MLRLWKKLIIKWSLIDCSTKVYSILIQNLDEYHVLENLQNNSTNKLIKGHENDDEITDFLRKMCFYIVPVVNPDGYEYSRSEKSARVRLWRKNRSPNSHECPRKRMSMGMCCMGVKSGTGHDPCQNIYGGSSAFNEASGASYDWAKGKAGVKYSYLLELRPQNNAHNGFIVDKSQIIPTGKETWAGIKVVARTISKERR
uniref:Peptidase M14 carboxypeptidase A domain-containing protein n=1 Tax=Romanomermis culicivorax TaxID=13658 RepID=A0A915KMB7_ROMCU